MKAPVYAREIPQRYRLEAARCLGCRQVAFPPRRVCSVCRGEQFAPVTLPDDGTVTTFTVIHVAANDLAMQVPYVIAIIELGGVSVTAQIVDCRPEEVRTGAVVRRVFRRLRVDGDDGLIQYGYKFVLREG